VKPRNTAIRVVVLEYSYYGIEYSMYIRTVRTVQYIQPLQHTSIRREDVKPGNPAIRTIVLEIFTMAAVPNTTVSHANGNVTVS
jgi:hypothetical protein